MFLSTAKAGSGNQKAVMDQLKLALAWNRIDIAKSEIFTDDRHWSVSTFYFCHGCFSHSYHSILLPASYSAVAVIPLFVLAFCREGFPLRVVGVRE
jgi:hypothetical protein